MEQDLGSFGELIAKMSERAETMKTARLAELDQQTAWLKAHMLEIDAYEVVLLTKAVEHFCVGETPASEGMPVGLLGEIITALTGVNDRLEILMGQYEAEKAGSA